ncbi:uncharacterized protein LOC116303963 [Actinia tenebrosa]|uniref:Uncharacterized protein LOC116303963 n=1 Tax=Actinia tenebrosa TaxID=6105 RepID=A0A6P8IQV1_ACTTE|nr:uncharacterized protein LOC116303963 [Actinia tenebrosa]
MMNSKLVLLIFLGLFVVSQAKSLRNYYDPEVKPSLSPNPAGLLEELVSSPTNKWKQIYGKRVLSFQGSKGNLKTPVPDSLYTVKPAYGIIWYNKVGRLPKA